MLAPAMPNIDINDGRQYTQFDEPVSTVVISLSGAGRNMINAGFDRR